MEASKFLRIRGRLLFECVGAGNIQQSVVIPGVQIPNIVERVEDLCRVCKNSIDHNF